MGRPVGLCNVFNGTGDWDPGTADLLFFNRPWDEQNKVGTGNYYLDGAATKRVEGTWQGEALIGPGRRPHDGAVVNVPSGDPITPVVTYPETVDLARVLAMPGWRHPTRRATKHDLRQFRRDINDHVGIRYRPHDNCRDPLLRWFQKAQRTPPMARPLGPPTA